MLVSGRRMRQKLISVIFFLIMVSFRHFIFVLMVRVDNVLYWKKFEWLQSETKFVESTFDEK